MADSILDQLKALQQAQDAAKRTVEELLKERDLLTEVASLAKIVGLEFNKTTENIGKSASQLRLGYELSEKLTQSNRDRVSLEKSLVDILKTGVEKNKILGELYRIRDLSDKNRSLEFANNINDLQTSLDLGSISIDQANKINESLRKKYQFTELSITGQESIGREIDYQFHKTLGLLKTEEKINDVLKIKNDLMELGKKVLGDMGPLGEKIISFKSINAATLIVDILEQGYKNFLAFDKAAVSVRSNLGALPGQAKQLESLIKQVGIESMHLGVTFDDVAKSINEITNEFTGLVAQDTDLLKITTALSKQFGIAEGTSVKFLKTLGGISGNSASSQRSMIGFAQKMAQASGVPLGKIMQDVAEASDDVRIYVGSSAVSMIKTATAARMLGIDMNKAAATAEKLLQFESSIASELKASALLGQNVNFNYARRLFFNKKTIAANEEILRITKQVNFNQLDPIKQKAYADAAGKSVGELQDMLQQEKNIQLVKNGTNEKAKKALVDYERMMQLKDKEAKNEGKLAEKQILQMANQEKLAQLQNKFNQLMSELAKPVMDIVEPLLDLAIIVLPLILRSVVPIAGIFAVIEKIFVKMKPSVLSLVAGIEAMALTGNKFFGGLSTGISYFLTAIEKIKSIFGTVSGFFSKLPLIGSYFAKIGGFLGTFGKFLGPIGLVINAFTFISSLMKRWEESPKGFIGGLEAIGGALYDTFLKPFKDAYDWISSIFVGKSPSELGLGIIKGIKSVGGMLLDAITLPFRTGYNFISGLFGGVKMNVPSEVLFGATDDTKKVGTGVKSINNDGLIKTVQDEIDVTGGFSSIGTELQDSLITSVNKAYEEIKNISPPEIDVTGGFSSISTELQDSLVTSVNKAYGEIKNISPPEINVVGKLIMNGFSSISTELQDSLVTSVNKAYEEIKNISPPEIKVDSATTNKLVETTDNTLISVIKTSNQQLVAKLDQLITMMSNGGIAVNLDGQKIDKFVATSKIKSGGFGQATMG